ncbi:MAG TPA: zf-HC2 domain-containing protein [Bryobacteraceae bacterium]|nr:zf-HC2 domain-containing protein [Bryobacteraceae bacterium]
MNCGDFESWILDRIDGRLGPELEPVVAEHLGGCASCGAFLAAQTELDHALGDVPRPELSPQFSSRVLARLEGAATRDATEARPRVGFGWDLTGLAAIAAAAGFGVAFFLPMLVAGGPWIAAGAVMCGGAWLTLAEPPAPSA